MRKLIRSAVHNMVAEGYKRADVIAFLTAAFSVRHFQDDHEWQLVHFPLGKKQWEPLIAALSSESEEESSAALTLVANIALAKSELIPALIDAGVLSHLIAQSSHENAKRRREALWTMSNMLADCEPEVARKCLDSGFIQAALSRLQEERDQKILSECYWVIFQSAHHYELVPSIMKISGVLEAIGEAIRHRISTQYALDALHDLINYYRSENLPNPALTYLTEHLLDLLEERKEDTEVDSSRLYGLLQSLWEKGTEP